MTAASRARFPAQVTRLDLLPRKRIDTGASTSDGLGRGMEMALSTLVFLGLGWLLDLAVGTKPLFTIILVVLCLVGQFVKMKADYDVRMRRLEAERAEVARARPAQVQHQGGAR